MRQGVIRIPNYCCVYCCGGLCGAVLGLTIILRGQNTLFYYHVPDQNHEQISGESDLTKDAFKILYATDDEHKENVADGERDDVLDVGSSKME